MELHKFIKIINTCNLWCSSKSQKCCVHTPYENSLGGIVTTIKKMTVDFSQNGTQKTYLLRCSLWDCTYMAGGFNIRCGLAESIEALPRDTGWSAVPERGRTGRTGLAIFLGVTPMAEPGLAPYVSWFFAFFLTYLFNLMCIYTTMLCITFKMF